MTTTATIETKTEIPVGMGQAVFAASPARMSSILGSCVAISLYASRLRLGMMSHVVLPLARGATVNPSKFADTAVPFMLAELIQHGVKPSGLTAKITGGACMFGVGKFMDIGEANLQAAVQALDEAGIPVIARDVGGSIGRRICFDLATGLVTVQVAGHPLRTI